ncbi:hypothetical protein BKA70DRAFT_1276162 [Coprinopsis sp. MPI-PUGE-AT-0042]|nr:hypothetical protein BKA70DRAFT_1276162 [Coprinopsis sp. MPI-PUGE-AT-0042]
MTGLLKPCLCVPRWIELPRSSRYGRKGNAYGCTDGDNDPSRLKKLVAMAVSYALRDNFAPSQRQPSPSISPGMLSATLVPTVAAPVPGIFTLALAVSDTEIYQQIATVEMAHSPARTRTTKGWYRQEACRFGRGLFTPFPALPCLLLSHLPLEPAPSSPCPPFHPLRQAFLHSPPEDNLPSRELPHLLLDDSTNSALPWCSGVYALERPKERELGVV